MAPNAANTLNTPRSALRVLKNSFPFFESILICRTMTIQKNEAMMVNFMVLALLILLVIFLKPNSLFIIQIRAWMYY